MVGRGTDPASKPMTKADIMTVLGAGMAVGLVAFILVASQVPNVPVLGWFVLVGGSMISAALITMFGLRTRNAGKKK